MVKAFRFFRNAADAAGLSRGRIRARYRQPRFPTFGAGTTGARSPRNSTPRLKPSSASTKAVAAARSCSTDWAAGRTMPFHSRCSGRNVTQGLKTSMKAKPGQRMPSTMRSASPFGSPEEAAGDVIGAGGNRDRQRIERPQPNAAGRDLAVPVGLGGRRRLALGHAVRRGCPSRHRACRHCAGRRG